MSLLSSPAFTLHPRLAADTLALAELPLSRLALMNDSRFPWVILVPRRANIREIIDLDAEDQARLFAEISGVSRLMRDVFGPDKLNIGAIGNVVAQLHVHIVARFEKDLAWPRPVWGFGEPMPYMNVQSEAVREKMRAALVTNPIG